MLEKLLFWGVITAFSLVVLSLLTMTIIALIYGDPGSITTNPDDPSLEKKYVRYMEKAQYEKYRLVMRITHRIGMYSALITFVLYGLRWYIMKGKK